MDREITWGIVRARYAAEDRLIRLETARRTLRKFNKRSERLLIVLLALGVMLLAVHLESLAKLG